MGSAEGWFAYKLYVAETHVERLTTVFIGSHRADNEQVVWQTFGEKPRIYPIIVGGNIIAAPNRRSIVPTAHAQTKERDRRPGMFSVDTSGGLVTPGMDTGSPEHYTWGLAG